MIPDASCSTVNVMNVAWKFGRRESYKKAKAFKSVCRAAELWSTYR